MRFINIHSHPLQQNDQLVISNLHHKFETAAAGNWYSAGLHPWYITAQNWQQQFAALTAVSTQNNILAIGECGLDKICSTPFTLQQTVFTAQIQLANTVKKPLIIHCVKAYDEIQQLLQQQQNKVPVIFHGFTKSKELAQQLTGKGYYLSFGTALEHLRMHTVAAAVPAEQLFLETDDAAVSIQTIYNFAAAALQIDVNTLSLQLQKNAARVFGLSF
jgi:TatD DNase family protein